jgi:hypothetical protein
MSWEYARDNRSDDKVKKDYDFGKKYERLIFDQLLCKKYLTNDDTFKTISKYAPDCFLMIGNGWYPTEIKYSNIELKYVELKKNQADLLAEIDGMYLQSTPTKYILIKAKDITEKCMVVMGYCGKPCYRYNDPQWVKWKKPIELPKYKNHYDN